VCAFVSNWQTFASDRFASSRFFATVSASFSSVRALPLSSAFGVSSPFSAPKRNAPGV
jgi:hypothetical protein